MRYSTPTGCWNDPDNAIKDLTYYAGTVGSVEECMNKCFDLKYIYGGVKDG